MSIKSFFSNSVETRELHSDPALRSNYYRNNLKDVVAALHQVADEMRLEVKNFDEIHKEMYMLGSGFDVIITITTINPIECAVDFKINFFTIAGFNRPRKKAIEFYSRLKNKLNFKGVSLHP